MYTIATNKTTYTVLPQIMARAFIYFQQLVTPVIKQDWQQYKTIIYYFEVLNQSFLGDEF